MGTRKISGKDFWVRLISSDALDNYMTFRDVSNRELAIKCGSEKHRSTISLLRCGSRNSCGPEIACKIEKALGAPPNSLFLAEVPIATQGVRRRQRIAA